MFKLNTHSIMMMQGMYWNLIDVYNHPQHFWNAVNFIFKGVKVQQNLAYYDNLNHLQNNVCRPCYRYLQFLVIMIEVWLTFIMWQMPVVFSIQLPSSLKWGVHCTWQSIFLDLFHIACTGISVCMWVCLGGMGSL